MSKFQLIGWSEFALNTRHSDIINSINNKASELNRSINAFTPQSDSRGNKRKGITNHQIEHRKFFDAAIDGSIQQKTVVHYCMLLRHQLNIEFSNKTGLSSPSKVSIISDCGQYFYREFFTKLFSPITRGYRIDEKISKNSTYSFFTYTKWLYSFIERKYTKKNKELLFAMLKEALGAIHDFFKKITDVSTTSLLYINKSFEVESLFGKHSRDSADENLEDIAKNPWKERYRSVIDRFCGNKIQLN